MFVSKLIHKKKKIVAAIFLLVFACETFTPAISYALTSGPSQPEMKGFEPVSAANMVDPFTGDFSYNIPLMDVDGYPVTLNYHAGATPDDEASWVGYGWSVTPGALNRQLRGLPDDFDGSTGDAVKKETSYKDHITKGLTVSAKLDLFGIPIRTGKANPTISLGVEYDNYRGIGTKLGVNAGISIGDGAASPLNVNNIDIGISGSSLYGGSASLSFPVLRQKIDQANSDLSLGVSFPYNSRAGLQGMSLSTSFNTTVQRKEQQSFTSNISLANSFISFAAPTYTPTVETPSSSESYSGSVSAGAQVVPAYIVPGSAISGYWSKQYIATADKVRTLNPYGFLYAEKGKDDPAALMDFNREKDIPYSKEVKYLPIPVPTNDLFMATSQGDAGQYKISRGGHSVFADPYVKSKGKDQSYGLEVGVGLNFDIGADMFFQTSSNTSGKWKSDNNFLSVGDYSKATPVNAFKENAYFKKVGEPIVVDNDYYTRISGDSAIAVSLGSAGNNIATQTSFNMRAGQAYIASTLERTKREVRNQPFSYLTAEEATTSALDKLIYDYPENTLVLGACSNTAVNAISRTSGYRKRRHISQVVTTTADGRRTIYGIPVYNTYTEETSFSITSDTSKRSSGLINYTGTPQSTAANSVSRDNSYSKQTTSAYANSYLLTGILSNDYVDVTGDGITDDDMGTAVKFNYHKLPTEYRWRTPYGTSFFNPGYGVANYNEGFISDKLDDKASYTYGRKEVWYLHSIESKTMVALFITEDRDDGLGVLDEKGSNNPLMKLKRLKEIRLYSKSDAYANKASNNSIDLIKLTPIKVVHFEYSYSLMQGLPNSNSGVGKLTLKKVYFTYGNNNSGIMHPYSFEYNNDSTSIGTFNHRMYDRWGVYKDKAANPGGMNNAEFPYTIQDQAQSDDFVSRWQLQKIHLPTGGTISVDYEADDYAYVQNKRAMQMFRITGIGSGGNSTANNNLPDANEVFVDIPVAVSTPNDFLYRYLDGEKYLFFKCFTDLDNRGHYEYVPGYAKIKSVRLVNSNRVAIMLEKEVVEGVKENNGLVNPIAHAGWQFIKNNLPKYAYPGYENLETQGSDLLKAIQSLWSAVRSIGELLPNSFGRKAKSEGFSNKIDLNKSFVRLQSPNFKKIGGGLRVKKIQISDEWQTLSGVSGAQTAVYTQLYDYTKVIKDNKGNDLTISSGVASYEPILGGEENPFHQPIFYKQNVILQLDNYYYIEEPFCEGLYPAPSVGYSRVAVKSIGSGNIQSRTGEVVNEFYTAKEYPTKVDVLSLESRNTGTSTLLKVITSRMYQNAGLSQGYKIENNDMHGKPKSVSIYNAAHVKISSTDYYYKTLNPDEQNAKLDNRAKLLMPDATVVDGIIGKDVEVYTDMRESVSLNQGNKIQASSGSAGLFWFSIWFGFPGWGDNYDSRTYRAASTVKVVNNFAVLEKVRKTENGSSITTENLLWDGLTGDVVMTKTQNEYDDPVYNLTVPANWAYPAMGQAYQNEGVYLTNLSANQYGQITNTSFNNFLHAGDEVADLTTGVRYWVARTLGNTILIDRNGAPFTGGTMNNVKIIRSGYRNLLSAPLCSYVTLKNPIAGNRLNIGALTKVLAMDASEYKEDWNVPKAVCPTCPPGYTQSTDGTTCTKDTAVILAGDSSQCSSVCEGDFEPNYTVYGTLIFSPGYDSTGSGSFVSITTNSFWIRSGNNCGVCQTQGLTTGSNAVMTNAMTTRQAPAEGSSLSPSVQSPQQPAKASTSVMYKGAVLPVQSTKNKKSESKLNLDSLNATKPKTHTGASTKQATNSTTTKTVNSTSSPSVQLMTMSTSSSSSPCQLTPSTTRNPAYCGPLERTGVWSCEGTVAGSRMPLNQWIGFTKSITVPTTKTYYIGLAADNLFRFKVDGVTIVAKTNISQDNFRYWFIYPVTLAAGSHVVTMEANNSGSQATFGAEIYNNTATEIANATSYCDLNLVFTTRDMIGQQFNSNFTETCPAGYDMITTSSGKACRVTIPSSYVYNPYVAGHLGNWRPKTSYVYQTKRENIIGDPAVTASTNTRYAGAYTDVTPFWNNTSGTWTKTTVANGSQWVQKNEGTAFNPKGLSIEEKDPLNRYSSVLLGYLDSKPVAVASNTRFRELIYDGFEDYAFLLDCASNNCNYNHFNFRQTLGTSISIDNTVAHSGNRSLKASAPISITQTTNQGMSYDYQYAINPVTGLYELNTSNSWSKGFTPETGKKYLISLWVKDGAPRNATTGTAIRINGADIINNTQQWPIVEGWKRIEASFIMPASNNFTLDIIPSGTVWVDDIRIAPFDGQVKSYVYDAISQRLMAEMDENNFATFYEYDSEGTLIRVKKETEKGIVTIKETRSSYRRQ